MTIKIMLSIISLTAALVLSACSGDNNEEANQNETAQEETNEMSGHDMEGMEDSDESEGMEDMDHSSMNHSGDGEIPEGLEESADPAFPVGSKATIQADHMEGMKGAEATIVGAYNTTVYTVSYTPTNGGAPVTNHKWVIHEELEGAGEEPFKQGDKVTINADHMEGMQGATATIDTAEETTVYMVDYTSTTGVEVTNHKWLTESELSAAE
ncbi:YdhK family protein [Ureibacillus chungkukjangi]|uniref:YdhK family protein n=1 Tax=Ureibacillus chungkukjangi TaxID=1202712 RepID=UPI00203ACEF9|nr:YdhK family protein [Ureibacillus chungkukjangi]MCM3390503.1 YdhK family protein [Ureibacillus chungkukjangi]